MSVKISDLLPKKTAIPTGAGDLMVGALSLEAIAALIGNHKGVILHLLANSNGGKTIPPIGAVVAEFPDLVADAIALAADAVGQEEDVKKLPLMVQIDAIKMVWNLSIPDPKALAELLFGVTAKLRAMAGNNSANAAKDSTSMTSNATSPDQSESSPQAGTAS